MYRILKKKIKETLWVAVMGGERRRRRTRTTTEVQVNATQHNTLTKEHNDAILYEALT